MHSEDEGMYEGLEAVRSFIFIIYFLRIMKI